MVAGSARGRRLEAPEGTTTRPTGDRVREAVFNSLHSLGAVEDASVLDLFAGSGALGIEALSRGAAEATFVDSDRRAVDLVQANLLELARRRGIVNTRRKTNATYLNRTKMTTPTTRAKPDESTTHTTRAS